MWLLVVAVLGPIVCNQAGWVAAEVGHQPSSFTPNRLSNGKVVCFELPSRRKAAKTQKSDKTASKIRQRLVAWAWRSLFNRK